MCIYYFDKNGNIIEDTIEWMLNEKFRIVKWYEGVLFYSEKMSIDKLYELHIENIEDIQYHDGGWLSVGNINEFWLAYETYMEQ
jgi:hypothetical protein